MKIDNKILIEKIKKKLEEETKDKVRFLQNQEYSLAIYHEGKRAALIWLLGELENMGVKK